MNEKQVKLNEFMIAFEKKSPLILISATAVNVTFVKKHPEALVLSILKLASPLGMHNAARVKHIHVYRISMTSSLLYQLYQAILFKYAYPYTVTGMESELFLSLSFLSFLASLLWL